MKVVHQETDSLRLVRLEETIKSAVKKDSSKNYQCIFDCSECGIVFKTREDQEFHDKKHLANLDVDMSPIKSELMCDECKETFINKSDQVEHMENNHQDNSYSINIKGGGPKSEVDSVHELSSDDGSSDEVDDFDIEYTPQKVTGVKVKAPDGVNIEVESFEFKEASAKLEKCLKQKGKRYMLWGKEVLVKSVNKNGVAVLITAEVTTKSGEAGLSNLMIYMPFQNEKHG